MSNAKRRHRRRYRLVLRAIRSELFRRHWVASGGIDGYFALRFPDPMPVMSLTSRRNPLMDMLERRSKS